MSVKETDEMVGQILRAMVRQEVAAMLDKPAAEPETEHPVSQAAGGEPTQSLPGVSPYSLVPYAEHVLREAGGGPLHVSELAERMYTAGFRHRRQLKHADQLLRSLNSLASPSQRQDRFERVGHRTLRLRAS